ncbi:hypothetical protein EDD22DRAFT_845151 [Suillus occidentalis]|nr:hypothetical protein EDD22DRAFT_845151 [Suillus occidentalis]
MDPCIRPKWIHTLDRSVRPETSDSIGYVHQIRPETSDGIGSVHQRVVDVWISNRMMDGGGRANPTEGWKVGFRVWDMTHTKNCWPCSPSLTYLNSVWNCRPKTKHAHTSHSLSSDDSDNQHLEDLEISNTGKCNCTNKSKGTVLFPNKEEFIGNTRVCGEVITEAIIQWQEQKRKLEKGYYPEFKMGMATVVFNDATTFCSKIKQIVLTVVPMVYELALSINGNTIDSVKLKASGLLKKAMYLHGHPDPRVMHLTLQMMCSALFAISRSMTMFAEFQKTIPPAVLFLVGTIMSAPASVVCSNKYGQVNGTKQTPIEDSETSYDHISMLFNRTNQDEYHGPKLCQMLKAWALEGMNAHGTGLGTNEGDDDCSERDIDLN